jgi:hypothetical protein
MKNFPNQSFILLVLLSQFILAESFTCDAIDDDLTGLACESSSKEFITVSNLAQLGSSFDARISFPSKDTWSVKTINSIINIDISEIDSFSGKIENGKIFGEYTVLELGKIVGEFIGLGITGEGEVFYSSGNYYKGDLSNNNRDGVGSFYFLKRPEDQTREYSSGTWKNDGFVRGKYYFASGAIHEGENDPETSTFHGYGVLTYSNGNVYKGNFFYGDRSGYGEFFYNSEDFTREYYKGHWINDVASGFGETSWKGNGFESWVGIYSKYHVGEYKDGIPNGQGTFYNNEREVIYQGGILDYDRHGEGFLIAKSEAGELYSLKAVFNQDAANGPGKLTYTDGSSYQGLFFDGEFNGLGILSDKYSNKIQTGIFINGVLEGKGQEIQYNEDGIKKWTTEINFKGGQRHGPGEVTFDDGSKWSVEYIDDEYAGDLEQLSDISDKSQANRLALVIGNDAYTYGPLNNAVSDSFGMAEQLRNSNFEVIHHTDVNFSSFISAIRDFKNRIKLMGPSSTALFYYAGHAVEIDGINYLNPINSELKSKYDLDLNAINMNLVMSALDQHIQSVKIVILDACRNNPFKTFVRSPSVGLANMNGPSGTIISYSTSPGQVSTDGEVNGYGIYTGNLISSMLVPNRSVEEVFKETRRAVQSLTNNQQTPWSSSSLTGDFYFLKE